MTDWIFQGNRKRYDLDAAISASLQQRWSTPRYRDSAAAGDRVWLQIVGPDHPGIYYVAVITAPTYEDPEWRDAGTAFGRWRTDIRFVYRVDPALLRAELLADATLGSFRPFRGFQGSTVPLPPDIARALADRAAPRLEVLAPGGSGGAGRRREGSWS
jgi:hypothetical protein